MNITDILVEARCCRSWPVSPLYPVGRCGYCGERPEIVGPWNAQPSQAGRV